MPAQSPQVTKAHYETLADLRTALRKFLNFSADAARSEGLPPQQHQVLLAIKGAPGRDYISMQELAERMQVKPHSAVGLVDRLVKRGLVRRQPSREDGRCVELHLTTKGAAVIQRLSTTHLAEIRTLGPQLRTILKSLEL